MNDFNLVLYVSSVSISVVLINVSKCMLDFTSPHVSEVLGEGSKKYSPRYQKVTAKGQDIKRDTEVKGKELENEPGPFNETASFLGPGIFAQNGVFGTIFFVLFFPLHVIMSSFIFKWF